MNPLELLITLAKRTQTIKLIIGQTLPTNAGLKLGLTSWIFSMGLAHAVKLEGLTSAILQPDLRDTFEGYHKAELDCALEEL